MADKDWEDIFQIVSWGGPKSCWTTSCCEEPLMEEWYPISWQCDVDIWILQRWIETRLLLRLGPVLELWVFHFWDSLMQPKLALNSLSGMIFFFFLRLIFISCAWVIFLHILTSLCAHVPVLKKPERRESAGAPETRIPCSHGCWESILDFHWEQYPLLTTELFL